MTNKKLYDAETQRLMEIYPFPNDTWNKITVLQDFDWLESRTWKPAVLNWHNSSSTSIEQVAQFSAALQEAVELAKQWTDERAGKPLEHR
jgi:hypothetical protein